MAKFDVLTTLPKPDRDQAVYLRVDRNGHQWVIKKKKRKPIPRALGSAWDVYTVLPILTVNRAVTKTLANFWKNTLDSTQRAAWDAAAAGVSWTGYEGSVSNPTGFKFFMACNRYQEYYGFNPLAPYFNIFNYEPLELNSLRAYPITTPPTWSGLPPDPQVNNLQIYGGTFIEFDTQVLPKTWPYTLPCAIALNATLIGTHVPTRYVAQRGSISQNFDNSGHCVVYVDWPGPRDSQLPNLTVGFRLFDTSTNVWGNPTWIRIN